VTFIMLRRVAIVMPDCALRDSSGRCHGRAYVIEGYVGTRRGRGGNMSGRVTSIASEISQGRSKPTENGQAMRRD